MINLLEGVPGSGKSYEAVVYHVLPALKMGRKVITNLPLKLDQFAAIDPGYLDLIELRKAPMPILGRWDAEAANRGEKAFIVGEFEDQSEDESFNFPSRGLSVLGRRVQPAVQTMIVHNGKPARTPPANQRLFGGVWDFYDEWRGDGNVGALFVIDECHVSFPKENTRKGRFTADEVIQWFKISRHFGVDVLLMTQRMRALEEEVAGLAEMHIRVRKAAFLGDAETYIRRVFAGFNGGEVSSDQRPYKPQYFGLYKSHTQGAAVIEASAQDVQPANVKWRRLSRIMFAVAAIGFVWLGFKIFGPKPQPAKPAAPAGVLVMQKGHLLQPPQPVSAAAAQSVAPRPSGDHQKASVVPAMEVRVPPEPMEARGLHLSGCMVMQAKTACVILVSQNGQPVFTVTDADLQAMGYKWRRLADCMAVVSWQGKDRSVICDSPQIGMGVPMVTSHDPRQDAKAVRTVPMPEVHQPDPSLISPRQVASQWREGSLPN